MRGGFSAALEQRLRRADPNVRVMVEADVLEAGTVDDVFQTKADWNAADSVAGLTVFDDGLVQLAAGLTTVIESTTSNGQFTDLDTVVPFSVARIDWGDTLPADVELSQLIAHLNPKQDTANAKTVAWWRLQLFAAEVVLGNNAGDAPYSYLLVPLHAPIDVAATGTGAGDVTFTFPGGSRPRPKSITPRLTPFNETGLSSSVFPQGLVPVTFVFLYALTDTGAAASNVGWSTDSTVASVTTAGRVLRGRTLRTLQSGDPAYVTFRNSGPEIRTEVTITQTPRMAIKVGNFADATITFSAAGNRLDLTATPTKDVQFRGHAGTPPGTSATFQVLKDGGVAATEADWRTYLDGQLNTDLTNVGKRQTYEVRCKLATNAGGTLTPTLVSLGVRSVTRTDLSDVATLERAQWGFDPVTLKGEIPEAVIVARRDGERDFQDAITKLLSENDIGAIFFRTFVGASDLARASWLHIDDWLIDDYDPFSERIEIICVGVLALARQALPRYIAEASAAPDADSANPGLWVDQSAGTTNLWRTIDEATPEDSEYIVTPADPVNAAYEAGLTNVTDPAVSTNHRVVYRYSKDVAAGKVIDLTIQLRQGSTVKAQKQQNAIPDLWVTGYFDLTPAEADSITDYTDLRIRISANTGAGAGSRRARFSWMRLIITGRREQKSYANQSLKAVYDDLIGVQMRDLLPRYRGPGVENTTDLVTKTITESDAKDELDAICFIDGNALITSQGRVKAVDVFKATAVRAIFRSAEIALEGVSPGFRQRTPEVFVAYDYDFTDKRFRSESRAFNSNALTKLGLARVDPPARIDDEVGKWVPPDVAADNSLANRLTQRTADALGDGLRLWGFRSNYAYPELEAGDLVAVETDRFVAKAPQSAKALKGQLWAIATIAKVRDPMGYEFTVWPKSYDDILTSGEAATLLGFARPEVVQVGLAVGGSGAVALNVTTRDAASVRVATSTTAFPSEATTRATGVLVVDSVGTYSTASLATLTGGQRLYVSVFAYETTAGKGAESALAKNQIVFIAGAATNPQLTGFGTAWLTDGTTCGNPGVIRVSWTPNVDVSDALHTLKIYRELNGGGFGLVKSEGSPASVVTYDDSPGEFVSTGPNYTWGYRCELVRDSDSAILDSKSATPDITKAVSGLCPI